MNAKARRKFIRKFERDFPNGKATAKQWRGMMNRFATYLRSLNRARQVQIVYELIELGNKRGGVSLENAIAALSPEEREGLAVLVGNRYDTLNYTLSTLAEKTVGYLLSNPKPTSTPPGQSAHGWA